MVAGAAERRDAPVNRERRGRSVDLPGLACAALAVAVRIAYLLESADNPFRRMIGLDMAGYDRWARSILQGTGWGKRPSRRRRFSRCFSAPPIACSARIRCAPSGCTCCPRPGRLGSPRMRRGRWRGRSAAWGAGILVALYKPAIFYTGALLPPAWTLFCATLCLWLVLRIGRADPRADGADARRLAGTGLSFGALALAQPSAALALAPAAVWLGRSSPPGRRARRLGLFLGSAALLPFLTFLYNGAAGRAWTPIAVNGGVNLYIGNGPEANGAYVRPPAMREDRDLLGIGAARTLASAAGATAGGAGAGEAFGPIEADRFWRARALAFAADRPARTAGLFARKLLLFFGQYEVPQVESLPFERRYAGLLRLPLPGMACLAGLALFGALLLVARGDRAVAGGLRRRRRRRGLRSSSSRPASGSRRCRSWRARRRRPGRGTLRRGGGAPGDGDRSSSRPPRGLPP